MKWIVENGVVIGKKENCDIVPSVKEIYAATDHITIDGESYPFDIKSVRLSKLIGLNVSVEFNLINNRIVSNIFAIKGDKSYNISNYKNKLLGYTIIENVWYFLDPSYDLILEAFNKNKVDPNSELEYFEYIEVINYLNEIGISYSDNVVIKIDEIKKSVKDTKATELNSILFPYQKAGANWLNFMSDGGCGCILGDEMGLGKTLQIIALFQVRKQQKDDIHFLVVAPVSLLVNWQREIEKFCPSITTHIHHGNRRTGFYDELLNYDVVITSYGNVQTDISMFKMIEWDMLVIDEAQNIKNPHSKRRQYLCEIRRRMTIAMTGTPFENHISDIWSISDFVIPGYLGTLDDFSKIYDDDIYSAREIERYLSPIMIRRKVSEVADELPEKLEISQAIEMTDEEALYYENERNNYVGKEALNQKRMELIQGLRMFCSHPMVYRDDLQGIDPEKISNKYKRMCEIIEEVLLYGEKILIFTSFNKMIDILCEDLPKRFGIITMYINGSVNASDRQKVIDDFSKVDGSAVLVLNPKAAGAGLNITCANHVIHYNLEWNPAIESQASARAYRRGQNKTVFIYRLFYESTIEEFVNNKIENKQNIFETAVVGNDGDINSSDLIKALSYSPRKEQKI
ncbi:MAG: DEAD/DEAH box helicase [Eubacterium sp.]|nr:DEAD/DEAH box helicase [Eubacterium sp.]